MVRIAIRALRGLDALKSEGVRLADHGCGKLRHYKLLAPLASELYLVDTQEQLTRAHREGRRELIITSFAADKNKKTGRFVVPVTTERFERSRLELDLIFSIAVLDVVTPPTRRRIIDAAINNLKLGGYFVLIIPRNDSSILKRCAKENHYFDGHVFARKGIVTFYKNFKTTNGLEVLCKNKGLQIVANLSLFRQVCLLWRRSR
jgi:hypothetical protein